MISQLKEVSKAVWGDDLNFRYFRAPARINVIGEHVDYLGGLVLPAAIHFNTIVGIRPNSLNKYRFYSVQYNESFEITKIERQISKKWANYILGMLDEFNKDNQFIPYFDLIVDGNIPQGAGLSSSAALEVAVGYAIKTIFGFEYSNEQIAQLAQKAENNFVGTKCGIMDQFIISVGKKNQVILLNTESLQYSYHTIDLDDYEFTLLNSHVKHSLEESAYNTRREECESSYIKLKKSFPDIPNLYSMPIHLNELNIYGLTTKEISRTSHVLGEKIRTEKILKAFETKNFLEAGNILYQTHESLSKNFEVSCEEIDYLIDQLKNRGIIGARMIGGGFGGCILILHKKNEILKFQDEILTTYKKKYSINAELIPFQISNGVEEIGE
jgi:galactokinase